MHGYSQGSEDTPGLARWSCWSWLGSITHLVLSCGWTGQGWAGLRCSSSLPGVSHFSSGVSKLVSWECRAVAEMQENKLDCFSSACHSLPAVPSSPSRSPSPSPPSLSCSSSFPLSLSFCPCLSISVSLSLDKMTFYFSAKLTNSSKDDSF